MWSAPQPTICLRLFWAITKSRMFSQTSLKLRGSSVPSPEYWQMSAWMAAASGSMALRVRNGGLPKLRQAPAGAVQSFTNAIGGGAADDIVRINDRFERERGGNIAVEFRAEAMQFIERERFQSHVAIEAIADHLADDGVGAAKRHA